MSNNDDDEINNGHQTRIYFGTPEDHFEPEFGIDEDVIVDPEVLQNSGLNSLILKKGLYPSYQLEEEILVHGNWVTVYGYVDVDDERE